MNLVDNYGDIRCVLNFVEDWRLMICVVAWRKFDVDTIKVHTGNLNKLVFGFKFIVHAIKISHWKFRKIMSSIIGYPTLKKKPKLNLCEIISLQLSTKNNAFYKSFGKKLDINLKKPTKRHCFWNFINL